MGRNSVIFDCQQHFGQTRGGRLSENKEFRKIKNNDRIKI